MKMSKKLERFCETLTDLAFHAGEDKLYAVNSRFTNEEILGWATEFEEKYKGTKWGEDGQPDYIDTVDDFYELKKQEFLQAYGQFGEGE